MRVEFFIKKFSQVQGSTPCSCFKNKKTLAGCKVYGKEGKVDKLLIIVLLVNLIAENFERHNEIRVALYGVILVLQILEISLNLLK